jgi:hypothetical protein
MSMPAARSLITGRPAGLSYRLDTITSYTLIAPDGDSDQINFLNRVTRGAITAGSAIFPGPGFSTGTKPPKSKRPLSNVPAV